MRKRMDFAMFSERLSARERSFVGPATEEPNGVRTLG